ncbi:MAG: serine hydrolase [Kiritimatiellae bacterium]|nr:serine hydrolase [Kiritimatiellia bacterium]
MLEAHNSSIERDGSSLDALLDGAAGTEYAPCVKSLALAFWDSARGAMTPLVAVVVVCMQSAVLTGRTAEPQPVWKWAVSGGGPAENDYCRGAACDDSGHSFVTGDISGTHCLVGGILTNAAGSLGDCYVVKYDPAGATQWVRVIGGASTEAGVDIDTDSVGSAVVAGTFGSSPLDCGLDTNGLPVTVVLTNGSRGVLLVKLTTDGATDWAVGFGGTGRAAANEVVCGANDEILATGPFAQLGTTLTFPDNTAVTNTGGDQGVWVGKWTSAGQFVWGFGLDGDGHEEGRGISTDAEGHILLCGEFDSQLTLGTNVHTTAGGSDIFVAKYDASGSLLWSSRYGSTNADAGRGIDPGPGGSVYVSGQFDGTVDFGGHVLTSTNQSTDCFLLKLDGDGNVLWARAFGSTAGDVGCEIESDASGRVTCAGSAFANLTFHDGTVVPTTAGIRDPFVARFDADGNLLWATAGGGSSDDVNFALGTDPAGQVTVVGAYSGSATYGSHTISDTGGTGADFFVARLGTNVASQGDGVLITNAMSFGGASREYYLHVPASYTGSDAVPLVFDLHGGGGNGSAAAEKHGWLPLSDQHGFIVVLPNAGGIMGPGMFDWNNYWQDPDIDDAGFLAALARKIRVEYNIDRDRIYMTGHSDGAAMANTFANFYSDQIAACAPVNGNWITTFGLPETLLSPNTAVPVWTWRGETETQLTGLQTRDVQDACQKAYWMRTLQTGPEQPCEVSSDGQFTYHDEIYTNGLAEYRFTETLGQFHTCQTNYAHRIWNEFFSQHRRTYSVPVPREITVESITFVDQAFPAAAPPYAHVIVSAPDDTELELQVSTNLLGMWTSGPTGTVVAGGRQRFMEETLPSEPRGYCRFRVLGPSGPLPSDDPAEHGITEQDLDGIRHRMDTAVATNLTTGCAILIAHRGKIIFREARGDMTTNEVYGLASTTKPVTATTVILASELGLVALTNAISSYIPGFAAVTLAGGAPPARPPTVMDAICNMSGISGAGESAPTNNTMSLAEYGDTVAGRDLVSEPGEWQYSGTGFTVAARCVESQAGVPFTTFIQQQLFDRLGMENTAFPPPSPSYPYDPDVVGRFIMAGGSLRSTLDDMAIFLEFHRFGGRYGGLRLLSESGARAMRKYQVTSTGLDFPVADDYGTGWWIERPGGPNGEYLTITGAGSLGSQMWVDLDSGVIGIIFTRTSYAIIDDWMRDIQLLVRSFSWSG